MVKYPALRLRVSPQSALLFRSGILSKNSKRGAIQPITKKLGRLATSMQNSAPSPSMVCHNNKSVSRRLRGRPVCGLFQFKPNVRCLLVAAQSGHSRRCTIFGRFWGALNRHHGPNPFPFFTRCSEKGRAILMRGLNCPGLSSWGGSRGAPRNGYVSNPGARPKFPLRGYVDAGC